MRILFFIIRFFVLFMMNAYSFAQVTENPIDYPPHAESLLAPHPFIAQQSTKNSGAKRIVALGGGVTEIIFALEQQARLVGIDHSSLYPPDAQRIQSVGYYRNVPIEGVLRLKPDLVIASEQAGPTHSLKHLSSSGIRIEVVSDQPELSSLYKRIMQIAQILGVPERGQLLCDSIEFQLNKSYQYDHQRESVMMIVMRSGKLLGAGRDTAAAKIIDLAFLNNTLNDVKGYRAISAEIVSARMPQSIIITSLSVQSLGGMHAVAQHPALSSSTAARDGRLIELDDLLAQSLGPRLPTAIEIIRRGVVAQ